MNKRKKQRIIRLTAIVLGSVILSSTATTTAISIYIKHYKKSDPILSNYYEVKENINKFFYKDVDENQLVDSALKGLIAGLDDQYAAYMSPVEYDESKEHNSGSLVGIGVTVQTTEDGLFKIVNIAEDSPASQSDIKEGDTIVAVDGIGTENMEIEDLVNMIKGVEDTEVSITVKRQDKEIENVLKRTVIETKTVEYELLENKTAYIKISSFKDVTIKQYEDAMNDMLSKGAEKIIFDLRNNGGGLLTACEACLDPLLPEGDIASAEFKNNYTEVICKSDKNELDLPMAVLVNENTASAAELFSSALRDFNKAKLVGKNTYGKGIMQNTIPLNNGGGLRLTVARYKTAKSECYHEIGLAPDYDVDLPENIDISKPDVKNDTQLKKAMEILN